tara:strand:- start:643 stop:1071 length:429 start_codon:yes stop_codon:yes gene_type:complete
MDGSLSHELLNALENETNNSIMDLTNVKIKDYKNNALQKLQFTREYLKELHKKLKHYRYIRDMNDLEYGYYIRWIPLKNPEKIYLTNGGIICSIEIIKNQIQIRVKNNMNRIFQIKFDECVIFQKITDQEKVILGILDYLDK